MRSPLLIAALLYHDAMAINKEVVNQYSLAIFCVFAAFLIMDILELIFKAGNK